MRAKLLVIDDEEMIRWSIKRTLTAVGHEVLTAESASEGLTLFREFRPDLVFLDLRLPDASGLTLLRHIKSQTAAKTAVIVMTASERDGAPEEAVRLGAESCLKKPFDFDQLEILVGRALRTPAA